MKQKNYKIAKIILLLLLICIFFGRYHRKTNVYRDAFHVNMTTSEDAAGQNQEQPTEPDTFELDEIQPDSSTTKQEIDKEEQKSIQEEEAAMQNIPHFPVSVKQFLEHFRSADYSIELDEQTGADAFKMYNITLDDFITIEISGNEQKPLNTVYVTTDVTDADKLYQNPTKIKQFLSVMKDIHYAAKIDYDEAAILNFVKNTNELNGETQFFSSAQMYSQYFRNQYYITITPKDTYYETNK